MYDLHSRPKPLKGSGSSLPRQRRIDSGPDVDIILSLETKHSNTDSRIIFTITAQPWRRQIRYKLPHLSFTRAVISVSFAQPDVRNIHIRLQGYPQLRSSNTKLC